MRGFAASKGMSGGGFRWIALTRSQFVVGVAILALYAQLAAGAFCKCGLPSAADFSGFPICHGAANGKSAPDPGHAPLQHPCPFCTLHCHAALALPPALHFATPGAVAAVLSPAHHVAQARLRFAIAAQPRGPPARLS